MKKRLRNKKVWDLIICKRFDIENAIKTLIKEIFVDEAMEKLYLLSKVKKGYSKLTKTIFLMKISEK